jgi:Pyruvate/2-oxoacid:ferredoxin oxidoreductase gamma subunit
LERELLVTGIGGQGVQLMATVIAQAAVAEGRAVQLFGSYGGMMRGGNTEATLVVAESAVQAPPTVSVAWSAIVMHHEHASATLSHVRADGVVLVNSSVCAGVADGDGHTVVEVAATDVAASLGDPVGAAMVMAGAYATLTGLVGMDALRAAAREALPAYRSQHAARNDEALVAGAGLVRSLGVRAWAPAGTTP